MKIATLAISATLVPILAAIPLAVLASSAHDFDAVVAAVEHRYSAHAQRVPMMGFVNFCAWVATGGGVKGMKIAEFDHLDLAPEKLKVRGETDAPDSRELEALVRDSLGPNWQPFVTSREANGEVSVIYVQPAGGSMRMMIADYDNHELDLVRIEVNGDRLRHWMKDPDGSAKHHDYGANGNSTPD
jgi:hypothetical protein